MAMDELGFYILAGHAESPRSLLDEVAAAERLGLGTGWLSERWSTKEAATLSGAAGAASTSLRIGTAATNHTTRHPIITASYAMTMDRLTGGRFVLGLGRGVDLMFRGIGLPPIKTAQLEDFAGLMRRLFRGERVMAHDGPAGAFPALSLSGEVAEIPLGIVAFGSNTLALGGRAFDHVVLHTFFADETLQRCVKTVKDAAERAGRDPEDVTVWSCFATVGDHLPEDVRLRKTVARLATYLQIYGDLLVKTNRWDPAVLEHFRADDVVRGFTDDGFRVIDGPATTSDQLEHIAGLLPDEWLAPAATGSAQQCADAVARQRQLGADAVILHGATPIELEPIIEAYAASHREGGAARV